mgnify:FL=1
MTLRQWVRHCWEWPKRVEQALRDQADRLDRTAAQSAATLAELRHELRRRDDTIAGQILSALHAGATDRVQIAERHTAHLGAQHAQLQQDLDGLAQLLTSRCAQLDTATGAIATSLGAVLPAIDAAHQAVQTSVVTLTQLAREHADQASHRHAIQTTHLVETLRQLCIVLGQLYSATRELNEHPRVFKWPTDITRVTDCVQELGSASWHTTP